MTNLRILVTGSRNLGGDGAYVRMRRAFRDELLNAKATSAVIIHGGANGADSIAGWIAEEMGWPVEVHLADWEKHGKAAGPIRNQEMVDAGADVCLAFPVGESRGTRDCMRRAEKAGIRVVVFGDIP
ncbi:MAG: DUF2493 domain-containing protein [Sphaerochaeta sp.]|nr:DUF2493 domain-containing protein [Sphaerochaeta sp.]